MTKIRIFRCIMTDVTRIKINFAKTQIEMIQSMTGFGKATAELSNRKITVEIKSLKIGRAHV